MELEREACEAPGDGERKGVSTVWGEAGLLLLHPLIEEASSTLTSLAQQGVICHMGTDVSDAITATGFT